MLKRAERLLKIRKRLQERAAAEHAVAQRALEDAHRSRQHWIDLRNAPESTTRPSEFERQSEGLMLAHTHVQRCDDAVREAHESVVSASKEFKRSEAVRDRFEETAREDERREEQRNADDLRPRRGL